MINDVYIPLGGWSDEITYYKQIEGILTYGFPRGYFGYNQTRAMYGTLGVWGIFPLIPYIIWGFFFGWNYLSPIYANILLCILAILCICVILRPDKKCMAVFSLFWTINPLLNRYILSGVVEAYFISQGIIVSVCGIYLLSDRFRCRKSEHVTQSKDRTILWFCTVMISIMTLARPYFAVLFLIPWWKAMKDKRRKWLILLPILAIGDIVLFFVNNYFFCSTYFENIFAFEKMKSGGVGGFFQHIADSLAEIVRQTWYAVRYDGVGVGWYYLLWAIGLLSMIIVCIRRAYYKKKVPSLFLITLIGNSLILLSFIEIYDLGVGARHILALIVANAVILLMETHFSVILIMAAVCMAAIFRIGDADMPPYRNAEYSEYMEQLKNEFAQVVLVSDSISYDNVVTLPTVDYVAENPGQNVGCYYGVMFALPAGVGISLDFGDIYYQEEGSLKAGYYLIHPKGMIRTRLDAQGMHCIYETEDFALYTRW